MKCVKRSKVSVLRASTPYLRTIACGIEITVWLFHPDGAWHPDCKTAELWNRRAGYCLGIIPTGWEWGSSWNVCRNTEWLVNLSDQRILWRYINANDSDRWSFWLSCDTGWRHHQKDCVWRQLPNDSFITLSTYEYFIQTLHLLKATRFVGQMFSPICVYYFSNPDSCPISHKLLIRAAICSDPPITCIEAAANRLAGCGRGVSGTLPTVCWTVARSAHVHQQSSLPSIVFCN